MVILLYIRHGVQQINGDLLICMYQWSGQVNYHHYCTRTIYVVITHGKMYSVCQKKCSNPLGNVGRETLFGNLSPHNLFFSLNGPLAPYFTG